MPFNVKITGGTIIDGTGRERFRGDIGIVDGKIVDIGKAAGPSRETIEADGMVVTPGFIDIHTHYDAQLMWDRTLSISPWHGITTVVIGNCGFGVAPTRKEHHELIMQTLEKVEGMSIGALRKGLGEEWPFETFPQYMDAIEKMGTAINVAVLLGHSPLRLYVMGEEATERAATEEECGAMRRMVRGAIEAGALGFSTSAAKTHVGYLGKPVPSRLADFSEMRSLVGILAELDQGVVQVSVGQKLFYEEFSALYDEFRRPITWTALLGGFWGPGSHVEHLDRLRRLIEDGKRIIPQVACRPINVEFNFGEPTLFETTPLFNPVSAADKDGKRKIYQDRAFRDRFKAEFAPETKRLLSNWGDRAVISFFPPDPKLEERNLGEVARERGVHPVDLALDLAIAGNLESRFRLGVLNTEEDEVEEILKTEGTVIALSDAGAHASQLCDACYATHFLGHWVREKGTFSLEAGVQKLTQWPAEVMGIQGRGTLEEGMAADIVVFDPDTVAAGGLRRVYDLPAGEDRLVSDATGIEVVMVNGTVLRRDNKDVLNPDGPLPGTLLRGGRG